VILLSAGILRTVAAIAQVAEQLGGAQRALEMSAENLNRSPELG
jgi:hypothetical protein